MFNTDISAVGATQVVVGLSAIVRVSPTAYQYADVLKILSGGGTLEIVPIPLALSGSSAIGWGTGYPISSVESVNIGGAATLYLAATGATMVAAVMLGYTSGITLV